MSRTNGQVASAVQRFLRAVNIERIVLVLCLFVLGIFAVAGTFAGLLAPHDPMSQNLGATLTSPMGSSADGLHLLGTDELGRDIFSRMLFGVRPLARIVFVSVAAAASFGLVFGLVAGFTRTAVGPVMMRLADIQLSIPPIVLALLLAVTLRPGVASATLAIAIVTWPEYARVVRSEALRVRTMGYVELASVAGVSRLRILRQHVLPNVMNSFVVLVTLNLSIAIIFAAALSFLGAGVQAPTPDWGNMLAGGVRYLEQWWLVVVPGVAISLTVLALNLLGDRLRDRLDPNMNTSRIGIG